MLPWVFCDRDPNGSSDGVLFCDVCKKSKVVRLIGDEATFTRSVEEFERLHEPCGREAVA